ncbi:MAG: HAD family hydrolase [Burkholderiales bacterium]|nr:HAD family hydrolase [Burkholderiales bacterium]
MRLTLFDLDGTLLPGDSDHAFGEFLVHLGWADGTEFARRNDGYYADYQRGRLDIADYIHFITEPWRLRPLAEAEAASRLFIAEIIRPMLRPAALDLIERHRRAGERLAIVTATNDFVTRPIAELLGVPDLIATELERDAAGRATGAIRGVPSFREGKVERVQAWLAGLGASLEGCEKSIFYSDSTNDLPLLERVSDPVATNPGPALERLARERGWPVLKLFE